MKISTGDIIFYSFLVIIFFFLCVMTSCNLTEIMIRNENGSTCTVDASITGNPQIDPDISGSVSKP